MPAAAKPKIKIEYRPLDKLIPYAKNARTHSDDQIAQIAGSIREFGWTNPVLVDGDNGIIAGHGRVLAARLLKIATVPVIELHGLTETQKRAYILADNRLAENAGWDDDLLPLELQSLIDDDFDISLTGFSDEDLAEMLQPVDASEQGEDDAPGLQEKVVTQPGDLWVMGSHRLLCGDSTNADDVGRLMGDDNPMLMVTDPPYGVEYDPEFRNGIRRANGTIVTARAVGKVQNDDQADWREAWALFPGEVAYTWCASLQSHIAAEGLISAGFEVRAQIIWSKSNIAIGRGHYHWQHEPCWYAVRKGGKGHWVGGRKQSTVWNIDKPMKSETGHSTQKPVECMRRPIENNSNPGQLVYDPFLGSGTTIIAAETIGRGCIGLELAPEYCDVIVRRWQDFANKTATLDGGGTFAEVMKDRADKKT